MSDVIRIFIVDDHQLVVDGIRSLIEHATEITCVGWANSGKTAMQKLEDLSCDVILLDINMPEIDGLATAKMILKRFPGARIIALTMIDEGAVVRAMLSIGAAGYLLKNVGHDELVLAIKRVHQGKTHYSQQITRTILRSNQTKTTDRFERPSLSKRELQILELVANEFTTAEISEKLYISFNTVESHRRNIMSKLGAKNTAGIVKFAIQYGLIRLGED